MRRHVLLVALLALGVVMIAAASVGTLGIPPGVTVHALAQGLAGHAEELEGSARIAWSLRLPRVLFGALVGACLGASGAATQAVFRNPLADPYLLGAASGAALGATVAVTCGGGGQVDTDLGVFAPLTVKPAVPLLAFAGAVLAVGLTLLIARSARRAESLLLSGVVVGSLLTAATTYLMLRDGEHLRAVVSWTLGNLSFASWAHVGLLAPYAALGVGALCLLGRALDALQLGDDTAQTLGLPAARVRVLAIVAMSLATGAAIAFAGIIGFVGLVAPHVMRRLGVPTHRVLVPASALGGAILLVVADLGARVLARPAELPVGVVTTLLGGPFFLWLLRRA